MIGELRASPRPNVRRPVVTDAQRQRVVLDVCRAARGVERLMPVVYRGEVLAWMGWSRARGCPVVVEHKPWMRAWVDRNGLLCGFPTVDAIIAAWTSGNGRPLFWFKTTFTASDTESWAHLYGVAGFPNVGAWGGTAATSRRHDDTEVGALMHGGNVSPKTKHVLSGTVRSASSTAQASNVFVLYDQVLSYDQSVVSTTTLNFTNSFAPLRYVGSGDPGLVIMGAQNSASGGSASFTSIKYTNQAGVSGQTVPGPTLSSANASAAAPGVAAQSCFSVLNTDVRSILNTGLVVGDTGVKQLDSVTLNSTPSPAETITYILGFQLAWMANHAGTEDTYPFDFVKQIPSLAQVKDGACLTLARWAAESVQVWHGSVNVAWA